MRIVVRVSWLSLSALLFATVQAADCVLIQAEACIEGPETRNVDGLDVFRDCWRWQSQYRCLGSTQVSEPYCQELADSGCTPIDQVCDGIECEVTFQCPGPTATSETPDCQDQSQVLGEHTFDTGWVPSTDYGLAASNMAALNEAASGMVSNALSCIEDPPGSGQVTCAEDIAVFTGEVMSCRKDRLNIRNCCRLDGWGVDAGLAACNTEEEQLGLARKGQRTIYLGRDCRDDTIFGCVDYEYVYCVIGSKIGRIVQKQGRSQLGIDWGNEDSPNCRGLTQEELQAIDFEAIDFTEYFIDAMSAAGDMPSGDEISAVLIDAIERLQGSNCSQFDTGCNP